MSEIPPPEPPAPAAPRARVRAAITGLCFALAWLWLSLRPSAPLQEDTSRDLAFARDLVDGAQLHLHGAWANFASLRQGTTWIDFLALAQLAGLDVAQIEVVLDAVLAAAVALAYLGFWRLLPRRGDPIVDALAPLVGAVIVLAALPFVCELPILWQPILLPLPIVLAHLAAWRLLRDGALVDALALAVFCALALDIHVVSVALLVPALLAVPLAAKRPALTLPAALALGLGTMILSSPGAVFQNYEIMAEQGWLPMLAVVTIAALGLGAALRRRFSTLSWEARLRAALGAELAVVAALVAASLLDSTPAMAGRYLAPFLPAGALALTLAASWAGSRRSLLTSMALAVALLAASFSSLRPQDDRSLPMSPRWRVAEFQPVAELLIERGLTWTELAGRLQGPSYARVLGHLSALVEVGSAEPPRAESDLLLLALDPATAGPVLEQLPEERVTTLELGEVLALLLETPARTDRHGAKLCRDGHDCEEVELAVTNRVYQAHPNAWIGRLTAQRWLEEERGEEVRELQWRFAIEPGAPSILLLTSLFPEDCAWRFVDVDGVEPRPPLPSHELELPAGASGELLISRELPPRDQDHGCYEHSPLPPSIIELQPEWTALRELLQPAWVVAQGD